MNGRFTFSAAILAFGLVGACALDDRSLTVHPAIAAAGGTAGGSGGNPSGGSSGGSVSGSSGAGGGASGSGGSAAEGGSAGAGGSDATGGSAGSATAGSAGATAGSAGSGGTTGGAILYFDDFEDLVANGFEDGYDSDGVQDFNAWTLVTTGVGTWYQSTLEAETTWAVGGELGWTDQAVDVEFRLAAVDPIGDAYVFVAVRFQSFDKYYWVELGEAGDLELRKRVNGSSATLDTATLPSALELNAVYNLRLIARSTELSAQIAGVELTATDSELGNGGIALGSLNANTQFGSVRVMEP